MADDIEARIADLLQTRPLPDDLEQQVEALVAQLPPEHPAVLTGAYEAALLTARDFEALDNGQEVGVFTLDDPDA